MGTTLLKVLNAHYTVVETGYERPMPIVHVFGRDRHRRRHHVEVEGYRPYFCVPAEMAMDSLQALENDENVLGVEWDDCCGRQEVGIEGTPLARIVCEQPRHVGQLREHFVSTDSSTSSSTVGAGTETAAKGDDGEDGPQQGHYEADVRFADRFLIDMGIRQVARVPSDCDDRRIIPDEIHGVDSDEHSEVANVRPRICYFDIEVKQSDRGPSVVSETGIERAPNPITSICAFDSYERAYRLWTLAHDSWGDGQWDEACDVGFNVPIADHSVYTNEGELLRDFVVWVRDSDPSLLTAWNIGFDAPYLVNRCINENVVAVQKLSPTRDVSSMNGSGNWINSDLKGRILFDMLQGYEKTQVHELDSYSLDAVASKELDIDKLDVEDIDAVWESDPRRFQQYVLRDVQALVGINERSLEQGCIV